jgi:hypothetical protein
MKTLRNNAEKVISAEIEAVKAVRSSAIVTLEAESQVCLHPTITETNFLTDNAQIPSSLKRKRSLSEDECFNCSDVGESSSNAGVQATATHSTLTPQEGGIQVPKPKRARRILSVVVQTTTAVTIGAAITWSALAFS